VLTVVVVAVGEALGVDVGWAVTPAAHTAMMASHRALSIPWGANTKKCIMTSQHSDQTDRNSTILSTQNDIATY